MIIAFGRRSWPLRLCCATHFAQLVAAMHPVACLLMATWGERVSTGSRRTAALTIAARTSA